MNGLALHISDLGVRRFYFCVIVSDAVFAIMTLLSDLKHPISTHYVATHFDLKLEGTIAVWYSSTVLFLASAAAFAVGRLTYGSARDNARRHLWLLVGLFFLALSVDETAQLHEKAGVLFTTRVGRVPWLTDGGWAAFAWMLVLLPLILLFMALVVLVTRWFLGLHARSRRLMVGGMLCWVGVLGAEFVQAQLVRWSVDRSFQGVIEEGLEIAGSTLFLFSMIELLRTAGHRTLVPRREMV